MLCDEDLQALYLQQLDEQEQSMIEANEGSGKEGQEGSCEKSAEGSGSNERGQEGNPAEKKGKSGSTKARPGSSLQKGPKGYKVRRRRKAKGPKNVVPRQVAQTGDEIKGSKKVVPREVAQTDDDAASWLPSYSDDEQRRDDEQGGDAQGSMVESAEPDEGPARPRPKWKVRPGAKAAAHDARPPLPSLREIRLRIARRRLQELRETYTGSVDDLPPPRPAPSSPEPPAWTPALREKAKRVRIPKTKSTIVLKERVPGRPQSPRVPWDARMSRRAARILLPCKEHMFMENEDHRAKAQQQQQQGASSSSHGRG